MAIMIRDLQIGLFNIKIIKQLLHACSATTMNVTTSQLHCRIAINLEINKCLLHGTGMYQLLKKNTI